VEFTVAPPEQWPTLVKTSRLRWSGDVDLDRGLLADIFEGLRRHDQSGIDHRACDRPSEEPADTNR
jgi:hypothetical protein